MFNPADHIANVGDWGVNLRNTAVLRTIFSRRKIFIHALPEHELLHFGADVAVEPYAYLCHHRIISIRAFSYTPPYIEPGTRVGRYCSIAAGLKVFQHRHPVEWVSTSPFCYSKDGIYQAAHMDFSGLPHAPFDYPDALAPAPIIENDVWIGQDAQLARAITIGTGAVIAAGAVVTKDVAPYMVVGGNPARYIRARFNEALIARFLSSQWWEYDVSVFKNCDYRNPEKFLDQFEDLKARKMIIPYQPEPTTYRHIINDILDYQE